MQLRIRTTQPLAVVSPAAVVPVTRDATAGTAEAPATVRADGRLAVPMPENDWDEQFVTPEPDGSVIVTLRVRVPAGQYDLVPDSPG